MTQGKAVQSTQTEDIRDRTTKTSWMLSNWLLVIIATLLVASLAYLAGWSARGIVVKPNPLRQQLSTPTSFIPQASPAADDMANWKIYSNDKFSLKYPANLKVYSYTKETNSPIALSDLSNPSDVPIKISAEGHTIIGVQYFTQKMPTSFPYSNGSDKNDTIQPYSINGYSGIRGKLTSTIGEGESVLLQNNTGYIDFTLEIGNSQTFDQILSTFQFVDKNGLVHFTSEKSEGVTYPKFSIDYPPKWKIDGPNVFSKGDYSIGIYQPPSSGYACIFRDSPAQSEGTPQRDLTKTAYVQIKANTNVLRYYKDDIKNDKNKIVFRFCDNWPNLANVFESPTEIGWIQYEVPENYDTSILKEMDEIVKTIKIVD